MTSSIYQDVEYYFKVFTTFIGKATNGDDVQQEWDTQWKSLVSQLSLGNLAEEEEVRILTIGSGEGFRDSLIIREVLQYRPKIYVRAVEPAEEALKVFRSRSEEIVRSHPGVRFDWRAETFEQYAEDQQRHGEAGEGGFHLVVSGHSLYYMEKWTRALDLMYDQVRPNGMLVVTMTRGKCSYGALFNLSRQREDGKAHMLTSDDVNSHLKTKTSQIALYPREFVFDIAQVFDETSETGNMLLDFLMQRRHFRKTAPTDFHDTVMDFLRKESRREGDILLFDGHEEEVVAIKTS